MKKSLALFGALILTLNCAFADRIVEVGVDIPLEFDQNYTTLGDILVQDLVIDLPALADGLGNNGFVVNTLFNPTVFANVNIAGVGVGGFVGVSEYSRFGISKDLFKLIAYGNNLDEEFTASLSVGMEVFAELGAPVKLKFGNLSVKATPSLFVPVVYLPNPNAKVVVKNDEDGNIVVNADAIYTLYSIADPQLIVDEKYNFKDVSALGSQDWVSLAFESAGFDMDVSASYSLCSWLDIGGYTHVPIYPGHLKYSMSGEVVGEAKLDAVLDSLTEDGQVNYGYSYELKDATFADANYVVNRPFRIGAQAYFTPFGNFLVFGAKLGFATRNPFSDGYKFNENSFVEYNMSVDCSPIPIVTVGFSTAYENQVFTHMLSAEVDIRFAELRLGIGSSSTSLGKSFLVSGLNGYVGMTFGF